MRAALSTASAAAAAALSGAPAVLVHRGAPHVTVVTLNRPAVRNAVDGPTARALAVAFRLFDADVDARVAVLTGAGGAFCSGADLSALASPRQNDLVPVAGGGDGPMGPTRMVLSKPVIAAIEGHAVAGGLELALWADLRVAGAGAVLGVFCRRYGVPLIDGGTVRLPRLIGAGRASDMILTGRPIDACTAHAWGLVDRVVPDGTALDAAVQLASDIAAAPQACMRADRASAHAQWGLAEAAALDAEFAGGAAVLPQHDGARFVAGDGRHGQRVAGARGGDR